MRFLSVFTVPTSSDVGVWRPRASTAYQVSGYKSRALDTESSAKIGEDAAHINISVRKRRLRIVAVVEDTARNFLWRFIFSLYVSCDKDNDFAHYLCFRLRRQIGTAATALTESDT